MKQYYYLIEHSKYEGMYYINTPKGNSKDFYNMSRAKDHVRKLYFKDRNIKDKGEVIEWAVIASGSLVQKSLESES